MQPHTISIGDTEAYAKPIQPNLFSRYVQIIIPYGSNTDPSEGWICRSPFFSKLNNMVKSNSIFNTKCGKFSIKCGPTSTYNNPHKSPPKNCSFSASFYLPISLSFLFIKLSLQFPPTLPPCKTQQFLRSLYLDAAITTISFKSFFPFSTI